MPCKTRRAKKYETPADSRIVGDKRDPSASTEAPNILYFKKRVIIDTLGDIRLLLHKHFEIPALIAYQSDRNLSDCHSIKNAT